jgi:hypothetical protein
LPDDRKTYWVYLVVIGLVVLALINVVDDPASDAKVQALTVLGLALASMVVCFFGRSAFSARRSQLLITSM